MGGFPWADIPLGNSPRGNLARDNFTRRNFPWEKYRKLLKSSIGLGFLKNYYKDIKAICKENEEDFQ